jgi:hypothetical protein
VRRLRSRVLVGRRVGADVLGYWAVLLGLDGWGFYMVA